MSDGLRDSIGMKMWNTPKPAPEKQSAVHPPNSYSDALQQAIAPSQAHTDAVPALPIEREATDMLVASLQAQLQSANSENSRLRTQLSLDDDRMGEMTKKLAELEALTTVSLTVGGGLRVYGDGDAIRRVQNYICLDSSHPIEKEDVRRTLARDLQHAEAQLAEMSRKLEEAEKGGK